MNREILFKAKRLDNGEWVEGDLLHTRYADVVLISDFKDQLFRCDGNTLCQYTGLTDKNGEKIWENDILRRDGYWDIRIEFENGTFMVRNADKVQYINHVTCTPIGTFNIKGYEVIGNIFDNADLLEVE